MSAEMSAAYPEWTEYRKKNGLDPLGMQTGSVNIYQRLLPGISNVTLRIRYYGLYAWLARTYAEDIGDTNLVNWQRFVRRAEALYALVSQHKGKETGVAGVDWASRTLENSSGTEIDFVVAAEPGSTHYYLKQAWGAYGAAYASQLYEIGIFAEANAHAIPVPGEKIGDPAADAFAARCPVITTYSLRRSEMEKCHARILKLLLPSHRPVFPRIAMSVPATKRSYLLMPVLSAQRTLTAVAAFYSC